MSKGFIVTLNNQTIHAYKYTRIPGRLIRYLDEKERDMQKGVQLAGQWVETPTEFQMQQYVALVLFDALMKKDSNLINVASAYLSDRYQFITEISITQKGELFNLRII